MAGPGLVLTLAALADPGPGLPGLTHTGAGGSDWLSLGLACRGFILSRLGPGHDGPWLWMTWQGHRLFWPGSGRYYVLTGPDFRPG